MYCFTIIARKKGQFWEFECIILEKGHFTYSQVFTWFTITHCAKNGVNNKKEHENKKRRSAHLFELTKPKKKSIEEVQCEERERDKETLAIEYKKELGIMSLK